MKKAVIRQYVCLYNETGGKNEPIGKVDLREAYIETRTKYDRQIHFIKGLISDILEGKALDERAIRNMNKIIDALGGALYRQTTGNLNVKLQISKRFISVWNEFHAGYDGQDNNSRYAQTKIAVKKLWENGMVEFYQYIDIYKKSERWPTTIKFGLEGKKPISYWLR